MGYLRRRVTSRELKQITVTVTNSDRVGYAGSTGLIYKGVAYNAFSGTQTFKCYAGETITVAGACQNYPYCRLITVIDASGNTVYTYTTDRTGWYEHATYNRVVPLYAGINSISGTVTGQASMGEDPVVRTSVTYREYR